jgi:hypothetical protein
VRAFRFALIFLGVAHQVLVRPIVSTARQHIEARASNGGDRHRGGFRPSRPRRFGSARATSASSSAVASTQKTAENWCGENGSL